MVGTIQQRMVALPPVWNENLDHSDPMHQFDENCGSAPPTRLSGGEEKIRNCLIKSLANAVLQLLEKVVKKIATFYKLFLLIL